MDKNSAALYKKMQTEVEAYQNLQKACVKVVKQRALLESQLSENKCVLDELKLLGAENKVYKLFGPVMVKQDLDESRQNVGKRIDYISKELKNSNDSLETMERDMMKHRETMTKYQQQWQVAAAMK
ncbi:probable prefoldin subunit 6 [Scaptodrosophila lebanonensis]|uniref:Probable prefoldin subunit 6 n=1 Tax=Drosophila lebanonensis TaxID=7225 RepID=A0A6J2T8K9_DROLE|nr:probable prefoldin subunit 6 [Scaptodrosophila lebanonensis]XP_030373243.1 probable prefoldin subunit 6 [Scaptodrosophila lebanonensis]